MRDYDAFLSSVRQNITADEKTRKESLAATAFYLSHDPTLAAVSKFSPERRVVETAPLTRLKQIDLPRFKSSPDSDPGERSDRLSEEDESLSSIIEETYQIVEEATASIVFDSNYTDFILVVGNTGTGKSTLVQFIAGDNSKLRAVEEPPGSGNLIIQDEDDKISDAESLTESKTLFPELVINTTKDMAFYDCAGFKDTRGGAVDMATTYLTKMVFDRAGKLKVHICVEYETAIGTIGRGGGFIEAIKHVGEFIRDAEKFKDSFSMVASKVPKATYEDDDGNDVVIPDEILIGNIGNFILKSLIPSVRTKIENEKQPQQKLILQNTLIIFTALSSQRNGTFNRIGLFRKPQRAGGLDGSKLMQKSRASILSAIRDGSEFQETAGGDFGFSVSDETKLQMLEIGAELNQGLLTVLKEVGRAIEGDGSRRMRTSEDWTQLQTFFAQVLEHLGNYANQLKSLKKLSPEFISAFHYDMKALNVSVTPEKFKHLEKQTAYLNFLENMIERSITTVPATSLDRLLLLVAQASAWYRTLYKTFEALSESWIQQDTTKYNVRNLDDWGKGNGGQGIHLSEPTARQFFKLLRIDAEPLAGFYLNEVRMNELNDVLNLTLIQKPEVTLTPAGILLVRGPFIWLSQVLEVYRQKEKDVKGINVFASCTVYIDASFTAPGRHMVVAAPTWSIIGSPVINLDGIPGKEKSYNARDGKGETPGEDGAPGEAGGPGGHFLGIADVVDGSKSSFQITSNGGRGGNGQGGGKGGNGSNGIDGAHPSSTSQLKPYGKSGVEWRVENYETTNYGVYKMSAWRFWIGATRRGTDGQRGGDGGVGGFGGPKGKVQMTILSNSSSGWPRVRNENGGNGVGGAGGLGGDKAKHGDDIQAYLWIHTDALYLVTYKGEWSKSSHHDNGWSNAGQAGIRSRNEKGQEKVKSQDSESKMACSLNDFKGFIISLAAKSPLRRHDLEQLLSKLSMESRVDEFYDTTAYFDELDTLESNFYGIQKSLDLTPYYSSVLRRVTAFADSLKAENGKIQKLALSTIYAAALSKVCSLRLKNRGRSVIVDLGMYMDLTMRRIEELNTMDRRLAIKDFQKSYRDGIELKVEEAEELMSKKVNPAIDRILREMDASLENLVDETLRMKEKAETTRDELKAQEEQMRTAMLIKGALGILKLGATVASFCGPVGAAVGGVVTAGVTVAGSFVVEPGTPAKNPVLLPPGTKETVKGLGDLVVGIRGRRIVELEAQLELVSAELKDKKAEEKVDLKELEQKAKSIRERLEAEKKVVIGEDDEEGADRQAATVGALQKELKDTLKATEGELKERIAQGKKDKEKVLGWVKNIDNGLKVVESGLDTYNKFKADKKKLGAIADSLAQADEAIIALQEYERSINSMLFPMVRNMRNSVKEVTGSLSSQSQVALDVTKWEVQQTLSGIQATLEKAMEGYKAEAQITSCFDKLNEALTLLMHIYDRLENFYDQQKLGDYIGNIGAPGQYTDLLRGTEYEADVTALNMNIQSNLVLLEFENAMLAFRQWVFPFAWIYLEQNYLPESQRPVRDAETLRSLVATASKQMKSAKDNITMYWSTISSHEKFFFESKFYANEKIGGPFYLWPQKEFKEEIRALFKGEKITLLADVGRSAEFVKKRMAVKFMKIFIRFNLKGDDVKRMERFEDTLEYFVVNMVHNGTSYYEFEDGVYVIRGDPVTLSYGVKGSKKGDPDIKSESRQKLIKGDLLLSPFTLWNIQLTADRKEGFKKIKEFVSDVSLELAGVGKYIYDPEDKLAPMDLRTHEYYEKRG